MENYQTPRGTQDLLPEATRKWQKVEDLIRNLCDVYGYEEIRTPVFEDTRVFKRENDSSDMVNKEMYTFSVHGEDSLTLRPEGTAGVVRSFVQHKMYGRLEMPAKLYYMGEMFRYERPQKGRYRQFVQCDIDIFGDATSQAEIELVLATTTALKKICPNNQFEVRINDRKILRAMAVYSGFPEEDIEKVFITVDKMDKIGVDGVKAELVENGYSEETADKYLELMGQVTNDADGVRRMGEILSGVLEDGAAENLAEIMDTVMSVSGGGFGLKFDPTLVRGMGYYTGTIFEVAMEGFGGSVAGGGRYDKMVGRFTGMDTPACGFSIGFERIVGILMDAGFVVPEKNAREAWMYEKGMGMERLSEILKEAMAARAEGKTVLVTQMNKNKKFQKEQLGKEGYTEFKEFYKEELKR